MSYVAPNVSARREFSMAFHCMPNWAFMRETSYVSIPVVVEYSPLPVMISVGTAL